MDKQRAIRKTVEEILAYCGGQISEQIVVKTIENFEKTKTSPTNEQAQDIIWAYQRFLNENS